MRSHLLHEALLFLLLHLLFLLHLLLLRLRAWCARRRYIPAAPAAERGGAGRHQRVGKP